MKLSILPRQNHTELCSQAAKQGVPLWRVLKKQIPSVLKLSQRAPSRPCLP